MKENSRLPAKAGIRPAASTDGYCRNCEALCALTRGERCDACASNNTRRLSDEESARLRRRDSGFGGR